MVDSTAELDKSVQVSGLGSGKERVDSSSEEAKFVQEMLRRMMDINTELAPHAESEIGRDHDSQSFGRLIVEDVETGEVTVHELPPLDVQDFKLSINPETQRCYLFSYMKGEIGPRMKDYPDLPGSKFVDIKFYDVTEQNVSVNDQGQTEIHPLIGINAFTPQLTAFYIGNESATHVNQDGSKSSDLEREELSVTLDGLTSLDPRLDGRRIRQNYVLRHVPEKGGHWTNNHRDFVKETFPPGFYPEDFVFSNAQISKEEVRPMFVNGVARMQSLIHRAVTTRTVSPALVQGSKLQANY